jgi:hypothetical protein
MKSLRCPRQFHDEVTEVPVIGMTGLRHLTTRNTMHILSLYEMVVHIYSSNQVVNTNKLLLVLYFPLAE